MTDAVARTRIGRVTLKRGGVLELLHAPVDRNRLGIEARVRGVLDAQGADLVGSAFVVWGANHASTCDMTTTKHCTIPEIMVPDFVRTRLLLFKAEDWIMDGVRKKWFPDQ